MQQQILISGVGGQGVLFLTKLLYTAAFQSREAVFAYEIHGMSQRGGSVFSSLKIGPFASPALFPRTVDLLIALESAELFAYLDFLKPGGRVLCNSSNLSPAQAEWVKSNHPTAFLYNADADALRIGQPRVSNLILLGRHMDTGALFCSREQILDALKTIVKPRFYQDNQAAFLGQYPRT